ncbi:hypothetical protein L195_g006906 [Trifolium pratense]|uniref:Uncharacterized protein n=1 Tax=Trifolium pratense TaxID=57577 RepID=A0A2K3P4W4_TRIPR|nr:hypothetical protein L195_g006906 [Trifolium pratense]
MVVATCKTRERSTQSMIDVVWDLRTTLMGIPSGLIWASMDSKSVPEIDALGSSAHAEPTDKQDRLLKGYRVTSCRVVYTAVGPTYQRQGQEKLNNIVSCFQGKGVEHVRVVQPKAEMAAFLTPYLSHLSYLNSLTTNPFVNELQLV